MKAAAVGEKGLEIRDVPRPKPKPNEVLVRVRAAGLNRAELAMASGHKHGNLGGAGAVVGLAYLLSLSMYFFGPKVPPAAPYASPSSRWAPPWTGRAARARARYARASGPGPAGVQK